MGDETERFDNPPFDLDVPTEQFPISESIPWNDWTFGLEPTTDWNRHDELHTRSDDCTFDDTDLFGLPSLATSEGPGTVEQSVLEVDDAVLSDFTNVSIWLNGAYRPPVPCSHCRQNRLQCLIIQTTSANPNPVTSCSSCVALFRECSLARGEKRQPAGFETVTPVLGHLHGVPEQAEERPGINTQELQNDYRDDSIRFQSNTGSHKRQFSRKGAKLLRDWFYKHQEWPYPSQEEKAELARETGFTKRQVSDWFTNARRRQKQTLQSSRPMQLFRAGSPIPTDGSVFMTPMERWQQSPPEDEPVLESAIQSAVASAPIDMQSSWNTSNEGDDIFQNSADDFTSISSMGSRNSHTSSDSAAWSHHSGENLPFPLLSTKLSNRSRKKRAHRQPARKERQFQCTFCTDTFGTKYDWRRHEKSVHLSLESWICTPKLAEVWQMDSQQSECRFCDHSSSSTSHTEVHEFDICATRPHSERTFNRKDHLWQHLRKFHHCTKMPNVDVCRFESNNVRSRCGFCGVFLETWSVRVDHLAEHFKGGSRMVQWAGDWGLDSSVLAVLRDAVLPSDRVGSESLGVT